MLQQGKERHDIFGTDRGYRKTLLGDTPLKESTATVIWETLGRLHTLPLPLLWNSFPWHPHKFDNVQSNRAPVTGEVQEGRRFLEQLVGMYELDMVVAVGKKAEIGLKPYVSESTGKLEISDCELRFATVRHPSFGGKGDFIEGMTTVILGIS